MKGRRNSLAGPLGAGVCLIGSCGIATVMQVGSGWFRPGDLGAFALWTLLFAAVVGHLGVALARLPLGYGALAALLAVPTLAFANVWLVRSMLGPWGGAFGFPGFYPWLGGGFVGTFVGMRRQRGAAAKREG